MPENDLSTKIRDLRAKHNLTLEQVAQQVGVGRSTVRKWETGLIANMRRDKIEKLARALHTSPGYLMGWESDDAISPSLPNNVIPMPEMRKIPILGRISAGLPLYAEEHIEGYTYTELNGGAEYFALRVTGDSMTAARIYDGDTLIVRRQDIVENGQIAVVIVGDDEATVKRFYRDGKQITLMPQSTNHIHQPQVYDSSQTRIRVIGLVVKNEITF